MSEAKPGYLITLMESGAYLGGVMITNDHGIPVDFKYTDPVIPTKVQRIIYGSVLEQYIRNHVIIGAIAKEITSQPSFFVVPHHQLFEIEEANNLSLISIQRTQFASLGEKGAINRAKENECLLQGFNDPHPIRVLFGSTIAVEQQESVLKDLVFLSKHMDLVEPLERLEKALKSLCLEKAKD
jgi:hypothetical protein